MCELSSSNSTGLGFSLGAAGQAQGIASLLCTRRAQHGFRLQQHDHISSRSFSLSKLVVLKSYEILVETSAKLLWWEEAGCECVGVVGQFAGAYAAYDGGLTVTQISLKSFWSPGMLGSDHGVGKRLQGALLESPVDPI